MKRRAAVDIGTNSFHLVVADVRADGSFDVVTTEKEMVRLGEGTTGDHRELSEAAIERGVAALARFAAIAESLDADVDAVATSAVREATNGPEFVRRCAEAGVVVEVISGREEARLIHLGVLQALPVFEQQVLVIDIGGGSTEMVVGKSGRTLALRSLKIGHLRLTNTFFPSGQISESAIEDCRRHVRAFIAPAVSELVPLGFQLAIGSSGTITELGDLIRLRSMGATTQPGLDTLIDRTGLDQITDELTLWPTAAERASQVSGLAAKRADVIVAGAILLQELFSAFGLTRMTTSPWALREGVLLDRTWGIEAGAPRFADLRRESLLRMAESFDTDRLQAQHVTDLALRLFDELLQVHDLGSADRELLEAGSFLHNIGLMVSHSSHHHHSDYIIRNSDRLVGWTDREVDLIAQVARYHRRSGPKDSHEPWSLLSVEDQARVRWLAGILRVAIALDRTRSAVVEDLDVTVEPARLSIRAQVSNNADSSTELFTANARSAMLASAAGRVVEISERQ